MIFGDLDSFLAEMTSEARAEFMHGADKLLDEFEEAYAAAAPVAFGTHMAALEQVFGPRLLGDAPAAAWAALEYLSVRKRIPPNVLMAMRSKYAHVR